MTNGRAIIKVSLSEEMLVLEEADKTRKLDENPSSEVATKAFSKKLPKCGLKKAFLRPFC